MTTVAYDHTHFYSLDHHFARALGATGPTGDNVRLPIAVILWPLVSAVCVLLFRVIVGLFHLPGRIARAPGAIVDGIRASSPLGVMDAAAARGASQFTAEVPWSMQQDYLSTFESNGWQVVSIEDRRLTDIMGAPGKRVAVTTCRRRDSTDSYY